jgi:hypothetical protein
MDSGGERKIRYGGGCLVAWQDDTGQWLVGTVAMGGDRGHEIDVETQRRVGQDIRTLPPSRVARI